MAHTVYPSSHESKIRATADWTKDSRKARYAVGFNTFCSKGLGTEERRVTVNVQVFARANGQ